MVQSPQTVMAIRAIIIAVITGDQTALQSCLKRAASHGVGHVNLCFLFSQEHLSQSIEQKAHLVFVSWALPDKLGHSSWKDLAHRDKERVNSVHAVQI